MWEYDDMFMSLLMVRRKILNFYGLHVGISK
jgi:hypothetical protein